MTAHQIISKTWAYSFKKKLTYNSFPWLLTSQQLNYGQISLIAMTIAHLSHQSPVTGAHLQEHVQLNISPYHMWTLLMLNCAVQVCNCLENNVKKYYTSSRFGTIKIIGTLSPFMSGSLLLPV